MHPFKVNILCGVFKSDHDCVLLHYLVARIVIMHNYCIVFCTNTHWFICLWYGCTKIVLTQQFLVYVYACMRYDTLCPWLICMLFIGSCKFNY